MLLKFRFAIYRKRNVVAVLVEEALVVGKFWVLKRGSLFIIILSVDRVDAHCVGNIGSNLGVVVSVFYLLFF